MKFLKDILALTLSKGIALPLLLIENALVGRMLGPSLLGDWLLIVAASTLIYNFLIQWTQAITLKFGSEEWQTFKSLQKTSSMRAPFVLGGIILGTAFIIADPFSWMQKFYSVNPDLKWLVVANMLCLWLNFEAQTTAQSRQDIFRMAWQTPLASLVVILFLGSLHLSGNQIEFRTVIIGITLLRLGFWFIASFREYATANLKFAWPTTSEIKIVWNFGWPILPTMLVGYVAAWGGHLLLNHFTTSEEVGLWGASYQIVLGIISLNSIFLTVLTPKILSGPRSAGAHYLERVFPTILPLWTAALVLVVALLPEIFNLVYGDKFKAGMSILPILSIAIFSNAYSSFYGLLYHLQGRMKSVLAYNLVSATLFLGLSLLFVSNYGLYGIAWAMVTSLSVGHLLYLLDQHREVGVSMNRIAAIFGTSLVAGILQVCAGTSLGMRLLAGLASLILIFFVDRRFKLVDREILRSALSQLARGSAQ